MNETSHREEERSMSENRSWSQRHGGLLVAMAILSVLVALMIFNAN